MKTLRIMVKMRAQDDFDERREHEEVLETYHRCLWQERARQMTQRAFLIFCPFARKPSAGGKARVHRSAIAKNA